MVMESRLVNFEIRICGSTQRKLVQKLHRDCRGSDWNLTWSEFMTKYCSFSLRYFHEIKSTKGPVFKPNDKVSEFVKVFSRNVHKCVVTITSKEADKPPKGSGSNAVAKMAKNLQVPPKKVQVKTQPQTPRTTAVSASPASAKKKLPPPPPAPRISNVNGVTANGQNNNSISAKARERNSSNTTQRLSRDNIPGTSGTSYLKKNLFNPNMEVPSKSTGVNARLGKRKYPEDDMFPKPKKDRDINDDDLDSASQLGRLAFALDFDDASSVSSQDSVDSQEDVGLADIRSIILKRWSKCSNTDFHKMLKEYRNFSTDKKVKWMRKNPMTSSCISMVYEGLTTNC